MSLLPSDSSGSTADQKGELQILGLDEENSDAVFEALSSSTARSILTEIHDTPRTASELAERTENSIQTVVYHLNELQDAELVQVATTRYSQKGKEMKVYAPADDPVVVFVGTEERKTGFLSLLKRLVGATAILLFSMILMFPPKIAGEGSGGSDPVSNVGLISSPGLAFLTGGLLIITVILVWWIWSQYGPST